AVLSCNLNLCIINGFYNFSNMNKWSAQNNLALCSCGSHAAVYFFCKSNTLLKGEIHLPVSCNNVLSHFFYFVVLLLKIINGINNTPAIQSQIISLDLQLIL